MSDKSTIEWTDSTWNPVTGCNKVSPGCKHCYAETFAERWRGIPGHPYEQGFDLRLWPDRLELPLSWKKPRTIFVNRMSDLFHEKVPLDFIQRVFTTMERASWHTFQILTKRSERLAELAPDLSWPRNVWMGVSIETAKYLWRADNLRKVPAAVRFLSLEPLLGPLGTLDISGIHWVIVGGESGPGARPIEAAWVRDIHKQCHREGVPFFFKQWGACARKEMGGFWTDEPGMECRAQAGQRPARLHRPFRLAELDGNGTRRHDRRLVCRQAQPVAKVPSGLRHGSQEAELVQGIRVHRWVCWNRKAEITR